MAGSSSSPNGSERRVALVDEPVLRLLDGVDVDRTRSPRGRSRPATRLSALVQGRATGHGARLRRGLRRAAAAWRLLPPIDHPAEPARCIVSGTGLTHFGSARDRNAMHADSPTSGSAEPPELTDSLRMFQAGARGRPARRPARSASRPSGSTRAPARCCAAHGDALVVPRFAEGGGEEAEIAGVYVIDPDGTPCRVGLAAGNEFSDHRFERRNYLNLAGSKLRASAHRPRAGAGAGVRRRCRAKCGSSARGARVWSARWPAAKPR